MESIMNREYLQTQIAKIVDHLDETWTMVADLIVEMDLSDDTQDACHDLDLVELRVLLSKTSGDLWRKKLPEVLDRYFSEGPDPDAQRDAAQDRAMREARGE
jgi:hypothetical protein